MITKLGIKLWGGRRYVVEVEDIPNEPPYWQAISRVLGLDLYQIADVIINLDTGRFIKNGSSAEYVHSSRLDATSLDTVVYRHGNATHVTPEELQECVNDLYRNR